MICNFGDQNHVNFSGKEKKRKERRLLSFLRKEINVIPLFYKNLN